MRPVHPTTPIPPRRLTKLSNWSASCRTSLSQLQRLKNIRESTTSNNCYHNQEELINNDEDISATKETEGDRNDEDTITTCTTSTSTKRSTRKQAQSLQKQGTNQKTTFRLARFILPSTTGNSTDFADTHIIPLGTTHINNDFDDENMPKTPHRRNKKKKSVASAARKKKTMLRSVDTNARIISDSIIKGRTDNDETTDCSHVIMKDVSKALYETHLLQGEEATKRSSTIVVPTVTRNLEVIPNAFVVDEGVSENYNTTQEIGNVSLNKISTEVTAILQPVQEETTEDGLTSVSPSLSVVSNQLTVKDTSNTIVVKTEENITGDNFDVSTSMEGIASDKEVDVLPFSQSIYGTAKNVWSFGTHVPLLNVGLGLTHLTAEKAVGIVGQELESLDRGIETKLAELDYHLSKFIGR